MRLLLACTRRIRTKQPNPNPRYNACKPLFYLLDTQGNSQPISFFQLFFIFFTATRVQVHSPVCAICADFVADLRLLRAIFCSTIHTTPAHQPLRSTPTDICKSGIIRFLAYIARNISIQLTTPTYILQSNKRLQKSDSTFFPQSPQTNRHGCDDAWVIRFRLPP